MNTEKVHPKISREFSLRLGRLKPRDKVRAIVMLRAEGNGLSRAGRHSRARRRAVADAIHRSAEKLLPEIDRILARFDGHRLAEHPNALGAIPVELNADGVIALADSDHVKAILEDQPVSAVAEAEGKTSH
jgi:hypothetical protein